MSEDTKQKEEKLEIFIPNGPRLGNKVLKLRIFQRAMAINYYLKI
jgi:energy-dependent translational throttle protein EttA